jgi:hypothetical protein
MPNKKKSEAERRVTISARVAPALHQAILTIANKDGLTPSRVIHRLIEAGLLYERHFAARKES